MLNKFRKILSNKSYVKLKHTWIQPEGYNTGIQVYNCVAKQKVPLILKNKNVVTWYSCGPTVYDSSHIGHASSYVKIDIVQRILRRYFNYNIVHVMNITDIDDKIIRRSTALNASPLELAAKYEEEFWKDLGSLNIQRASLVLRVSENINIIKLFIKNLLENNYAYKAKDGSVYFDVDRIGQYGKLQNIDSESDHVKSDVKKKDLDFALWKAPKDGEPFWDSDWGPGRPGWHIECSALAGTVFGSTIDVHTGGIDLRFPHHENEEAQCCAYFSERQWVNYWLHTGHLHLKDSVKMSKSLKNTVTITEMLQKWDSDIFRFACLMSHYRSSMEYSDDMLKTAANVLNKYKFFSKDCNAYLKGHLKGNLNNEILINTLSETSSVIENAIKDDFNTPLIIQSLNNLVSTTNKMLHSTATNVQSPLKESLPVLAVLELVSDTFKNFGINLSTSENAKSEDDTITVMEILNEFRQNVRQQAISTKEQSLLQLCDGVRENVKKHGFVITDYGHKSSWSR